ncbi:MAG: T9SS type A sorting domain-containing protein [Bacteroidota bacterium]
MKKLFTIPVMGILISLTLTSFSQKDPLKPQTDEYIVIAWNDLGMHCANQDFSNMSILPPFNNQKAHVILKGNASALPTVEPHSSGIYVTYEIPGNTYSVGKTNFWSYVQHLFGVTLAPNIGLTGFGLTGTMLNADTINYHYVTGIPITAYKDATPTIQTPYQLTLIKAYSSGGTLLTSTQSVIPISHEINCVSSGCHSSEMDILQEHEQVQGFDIANKPILCAACHSDNALGAPGQTGVPPFSQAVHQKHGGFINSGTTADCYKCHPGPNTQCWRDIMHTMGGTVSKCQDCHGSVSNVGNTIENGRNPWLQEPSCGASSCHGSNYAEEPGKLFRQSKGHGGLFCSTCHSSPHTILPSERPEDNVQNIALQGFSGTLRTCTVCHGYIPAAPGPHGYNPVGIQPVNGNIPSESRLLQNYPNPASFMTNIPYQINQPGNVRINILDMNGRFVASLMNDYLQPGEYKAEFYTGKFSPGTYLCSMNVNGKNNYRKIIIIN